jgi:hypothetical protein
LAVEAQNKAGRPENQGLRDPDSADQCRNYFDINLAEKIILRY